jgi:hypothetical protein
VLCPRRGGVLAGKVAEGKRAESLGKLENLGKLVILFVLELLNFPNTRDTVSLVNLVTAVHTPVTA